jgi:hypothetical protein
MKMFFVAPMLPASIKRPIIRLHKPRTVYNHAQTDLTETMRRDALRTDTYFNQNLEFLDRDYDFDEFQDIDNEHEGLTITESMTETELFQFCTGYDII